MTLIPKIIKGIVCFALASFYIQGFSQVNYMELFDTVPEGSKQIAFADLLLTEKGDSVFVLSHNNRRHYGDLDTNISPIFGDSGLIPVGWDTIPFYPVDSITYGNLIARCDTGTLECDTSHFFRNHPFETLNTPIKLLNFSNSQLLAVSYRSERVPDSRSSVSTFFFYIDKSTLNVDSSKSLQFKDMPPVDLFYPYDAIINPEDGHIFMCGWIRFEKDVGGKGGSQGMIIELDENLNVVNHKTIYEIEDFSL